MLKTPKKDLTYLLESKFPWTSLPLFWSKKECKIILQNPLKSVERNHTDKDLRFINFIGKLNDHIRCNTFEAVVLTAQTFYPH